MNSQAIQILYDEHAVILEAIDQVRILLEAEDLSAQSETLQWFITFFSQYGDTFHHHKEEDLLFSVLARKNEMLAGGIVQALCEHHEMFRENLRDLRKAVSGENWKTVTNIFTQYLSDLTDHISAENDELFITAEELLDNDEKESLYFSFLDKDRELDENMKRKYEERILGEI